MQKGFVEEGPPFGIVVRGFFREGAPQPYGFATKKSGFSKTLAPPRGKERGNVEKETHLGGEKGRGGGGELCWRLKELSNHQRGKNILCIKGENRDEGKKGGGGVQ